MKEETLQNNEVVFKDNIQNIRKDIISHLRSNDAQRSQDAVNSLEWEQQTNSMGQVAFWWYENKQSSVAVLSTGTTVQGNVKIRRYFDESLNEWIYKTERKIEDKDVFQFSRLVKKQNDTNWIFRTFACNHNKIDVIDQLKSSNPQSKLAHIRYNRIKMYYVECFTSS